MAAENIYCGRIFLLTMPITFLFMDKIITAVDLIEIIDGWDLLEECQYLWVSCLGLLFTQQFKPQSDYHNASFSSYKKS